MFFATVLISFVVEHFIFIIFLGVNPFFIDSIIKFNTDNTHDY
jgi:hypothetical protein